MKPHKLGGMPRIEAPTVAEHNAMRRRQVIEAAADDRDVWMVGGGALAADFAEAGMLDDVLLTYAPVTLGAGQPLFPRPFNLRLRDQGRSGPFLVAIYDVVGARKARHDAVAEMARTTSTRAMIRTCGWLSAR